MINDKLKIFLILLLISGITIGIVEAKIKTSSTNTSVPQTKTPVNGWKFWKFKDTKG